MDYNNERYSGNLVGNYLEEMSTNPPCVGPNCNIEQKKTSNKEMVNYKGQSDLLRKIEMYDFVCLEAALFLDTHPNDKVALDYFLKFRDKAEDAKKMYAAKYGPIEQSQVTGKSGRWEWINSPWPWEGNKEV